MNLGAFEMGGQGYEVGVYYTSGIYVFWLSHSALLSTPTMTYGSNKYSSHYLSPVASVWLAMDDGDEQTYSYG